MVKVILFDLGGVFIEVDPQKLIPRLCRELKGVSREAVLKVVRDPGLKEAYEKGAIDNYTFYEEIRERVHGHFSFEFFKGIWQGIFSPNPPMIDLLPTLKTRYRLALFSNTNALHIAYLQKHYSFFRFFDLRIYSHEVGFVKPEEAIFRLALERSESKPEECIFMDDCLANVRAATLLGIPAYLFRAPQFVQKTDTDGGWISVEDLLLTDRH